MACVSKTDYKRRLRESPPEIFHTQHLQKTRMKNLQTTVDHGAVPFIPFKSNTQPDRGTDLWSKMFFFSNYKREEFLAHDHKRSNVESILRMNKSKLGRRLKSKITRAQVNEALCKVLCHNLCVVIQSMYELNIKPEFMSDAA